MKEFIGFKRGINLGGWLSQCTHTKENYDTYITEEDIARIASWGLDHVRLPFESELVEKEDGTYLEEGFFYINQCIKWCKKFGLNIVLDLHKTAGTLYDNEGKASEFFKNESYKQRFINLWQEIAKRYGMFFEHMAFELLNEVENVGDAEHWNKLIKDTIKCIRKYAPVTKIIVGGVFYNSITSIKFLNCPLDENIVYNFYCYEPILFTHQSADWIEGMPLDYELEYPVPLEYVEEQTRSMLDNKYAAIFNVSELNELGKDFFDKILFEAGAFSQLRNVPLYCGEYGVIDRAPLDGTLQWFRDIHANFEKYHIGRAVWNYKKMDFGITDPHYDLIREELIKNF